MTVHDHSARPYDWVGDWSGRRARLTPGRVGLRDATTGAAFTYADLDARANRTARLLRGYGVADGERVVVVSRNRPELIDLFFATGKTGGVLAPLSHRLAPPELAELIAAVEPQLLVAEEPFLDEATTALDDAGVDAPLLVLPDDAGDGGGDAGDFDHDAWSDHHVWADVLPADDAPVETADVSLADPHLFLHTGGSTGTPKETVITHGSILWNSVNTITAWGLRDDDATPMVFPLFHTGGWNVLTVPLFHMGAEVVIARSFDPGEVLRLVDEDDATVLVAVPAILRAMVHHDDWASADLDSLRLVKSGGGPCRESVMRAWWDRGVDLSQGYGLTECGPNNFAMPEGWDEARADTVGAPAMHVDARVVDDDGSEVPPNEVGELELASPHAADRYWRNEAETAATFGADDPNDGRDDADAPARDDPPTGWVSTGDLARVDDEGYYSIEGRKKHMYVSGGENVYPAEVEDAITTHPKVEDAVVVPVDDEQWGQVGKAVVVGDDSLTLRDLTEHLDGRLARFKRPRHLAFVDELPTSGPDKIDREAVQERFGNQ